MLVGFSSSLEVEPANDEILGSVFRAFHTVKGGASFLDANHLVEWSHDLETRLDKLSSHGIPVTSDCIDVILRGLDVVDRRLTELAQGAPPTSGPEDLGVAIQRLAQGQSARPETHARTPTPTGAAVEQVTPGIPVAIQTPAAQALTAPHAETTGFSTKEVASEVSGRGVGMDVVRETTHKLRGRLSVETNPGQGRF